MVMDAVGSAASAIGGALGLIKPDKAKLECVGPNMPDGASTVECMFNPTEYRLTTAVSIKGAEPTPARVGGTPQYNGTGPITLTAQLFFDDFASPKGDVTPKINTLLSWTRPTKKTEKTKPEPPLVAFKWGGNPQLKDFQGYLTNVTVNYLLFSKDGTPLQAKVDITIQFALIPGKEVGQNPTSHAANSRRVHTMVDGDTLQSVAYRELGQPAYWRAIAELNGIDDPQRVAAGTTLLIPSRADAARRG